MLSYYEIYYETFRSTVQQTEKAALSLSMSQINLFHTQKKKKKKEFTHKPVKQLHAFMQLIFLCKVHLQSMPCWLNEMYWAKCKQNLSQVLQLYAHISICQIMTKSPHWWIQKCSRVSQYMCTHLCVVMGIQGDQFHDLYLQIIPSVLISTKVSIHSSRVVLYDRRWGKLGIAAMTYVTEMFTEFFSETRIDFTYIFDMAAGAGQQVD